MKKNNAVVIVVCLVFSLLSLIGFASCSKKTTEAPKMQEQAADTMTAEYTCPMHPEVISDKPGKCPKCGMDLVPKTQK